MKKHLSAFLPAALLGLLLACIYFLPKHQGLATPSISGDLPLGYSLPGWDGVKVQESEAERKILASDTKFSKAKYTLQKRVPWEQSTPAVEVSIVYSGQEMNNSIHRPEVCLPSQGHLNVQGTESKLTLQNGKEIKLTRLSSKLPIQNKDCPHLQFIHYYLFIGNGTINHTHLGRNIQDIMDRLISGKVQSWAYFQAGTHWAPELGLSEKDADARLRKLISELLPRQIDWEQVK
ncbi:MAG: exosortase-associated EpsI family protein [Akkermansia sp.]|nr:exosortase-associated EpsI family protein [Akkermansia sp.]